MKILTVGDGDLSLSTALTRAYPSLDVTATSLLNSKEELLRTYPNALIEELEQKSAAILYGIDATQLHSIFHADSFDLVVFHHPHLGDYHEKDERLHRQRHFCLLAHYLASASVISPRVHIALCGSQHISWRLEEATGKAGLKQVLEISVSKPFHHLFLNFDGSLVQIPTYSKRVLRKKTGSKHWLVKYGYTHQRTFLTGPAVDLSGSKHYLFERSLNLENRFDQKSMDTTTTICAVCGHDAGSLAALRDHCVAPSLPVTYPLNESGENNQPVSSCTTKNNNNNNHTAFCDKRAQEITVDRDRGRNSTIVLDVAVDYEGKRLRWYLQHVMNYSKRQAQDCITTGRIQLNGHGATDSSRILRPKDRIEVETAEACQSGSSIEIVERWNDQAIVAWKPVGMRCNDTAESLVALVSAQERRSYSSISKLDTGCSGLCLLVALPLPSPPPEVEHTFTALVHGKPKIDGAVEITVGDLRRWKQVQSKEMVSATIQCLEQTEDLSTVTIILNKSIPSATSAICYYFRTIVGCPVVGDRFAGQEYLTLPRSVRNRLKHRLCFMCNAIRSNENYTKVSVPTKLQALHWKTYAKSETHDDSKHVQALV